MNGRIHTESTAHVRGSSFNKVVQSLYVCMYVCMYVCSTGASTKSCKVCMHVCMHVCMCVYVRMYIAHVRGSTFNKVVQSLHVYVCIYLCLHTYVCTINNTSMFMRQRTLIYSFLSIFNRFSISGNIEPTCRVIYVCI